VPKPKLRIEPLSVVALVLVFLCGSVYLAHSWITIDRGMVIHRLTEETARLASTLFFAKMTAVGQLTIGLLGATWAMLAVKETKISIASKSALVTFIVTNASFAISLLAYNQGYDFIVQRIFHHSAFDIDAPFVVLVNNVQKSFFIYGCLALALTIIIGRRTT
jgi:hypothetical protein